LLSEEIDPANTRGMLLFINDCWGRRPLCGSGPLARFHAVRLGVEPAAAFGSAGEVGSDTKKCNTVDVFGQI
jgi:hypothetical protein